MPVTKRHSPKPETMVQTIYRTLSQAWGPQHWWPAESPFEVIVGAILTQNTSWTNVESALNNLRSASALGLDAMRTLPLNELEQLIRSSGYYRQKAARLKNFIAYLDRQHAGSLERMFATPTEQLRNELLALKGIGQETADAILLYAARHEVFVVDAYARRVLGRHGAIKSAANYEEIRKLVERSITALEPAAALPVKNSLPERFVIHKPSVMSTSARSSIGQAFNEMHGLLVQVGKHYCWKQAPNCKDCPLRPLLP